MSESSQSGVRDPIPRGLRRIALAVPDVITAGLCAAAWWAPQVVPSDLLRTTALMMVIEFLVIHGTLMIPLAAFFVRGPRASTMALAMAAACYALFALGASLALDTWWPSLVFLWLLASRYVVPRWSASDGQALVDSGALWMVSMLLWMVLLFATVLLPLPSLGWDAAARQELRLPGSGLWVQQPHRLLAFAATYFAGLALFKFVSSRAGPAPGQPPSKSLGEQRRESRAAGERAMAERRRQLAQRRAGAGK